jgi:hypothetical protein
MTKFDELTPKHLDVLVTSSNMGPIPDMNEENTQGRRLGHNRATVCVSRSHSSAPTLRSDKRRGTPDSPLNPLLGISVTPQINGSASRFWPLKS